MVVPHGFAIPTRNPDITPVRAVHVINHHSPSGVFMYVTKLVSNNGNNFLFGRPLLLSFISDILIKYLHSIELVPKFQYLEESFAVVVVCLVVSSVGFKDHREKVVV